MFVAKEPQSSVTKVKYTLFSCNHVVRVSAFSFYFVLGPKTFADTRR
jgi:hypothetical protein